MELSKLILCEARVPIRNTNASVKLLHLGKKVGLLVALFDQSRQGIRGMICLQAPFRTISPMETSLISSQVIACTKRLTHATDVGLGGGASAIAGGRACLPCWGTANSTCRSVWFGSHSGCQIICMLRLEVTGLIDFYAAGDRTKRK